MKLLAFCLLTLLFAVVVAPMTVSDTGYMMLTIAGWTIQTSVTFFLIVLLVSFALLYFSIRMVVRFFELPDNLQVWQAHRKLRYAEQYLTDGLTHLTVGDWGKAEQTFCQAASYSQTPYISYLCAARAAQGAGLIAKRDDYLRLASEHQSSASLIVGITQAELQLSQKQTEQALATLKNLESNQPAPPQIKQLLLETYMNLHDWQAALDLMSAVKITRLYSPEQLQAKQLESYAGLLKEMGAKKDQAQLEMIWANIPRKLRQHTYLIEVYVSERLHFADTVDCEILLRKAIKRQWDSALVRLYGLIVATDPAKQLAVAESYLKNHTHDAALLLTLGRICKHNRLWGKAKKYLQESIDAQQNPEAYYEYAKLYEREGKREESLNFYEKGLALVANANQ